MKIKDLSKQTSGLTATFVGILVKNNMQPKNGGGEYLQVGFKDASGSIEFPVFDRCDIIHEKLEEGRIYSVTGPINIWNGNVQIKSPMFMPLDTEKAIAQYGRDYFLPSYSDECITNAISYMTSVIESLKEPYKSIAYDLTGLNNVNSKRYLEFVNCPSAEKHHGAKIGGLIVHTAGVVKNVNDMLSNYIFNYLEKYENSGDCVVNVDRVKLKAIIHDIAKISEYEYKTVIRRIPNVVGHLIDGCADIQASGIKFGLSREEIENIKYSILSHHGQYGPYQPKTLEDEVVHLADMIDARFIGEIEK